MLKPRCHKIGIIHLIKLVGNFQTWAQWISLVPHPSRKFMIRHQMETFSALPALCAGNSPVTGELPAQRPVTQSFDVFFDLRLNKRLSKQSWGWWFETPSYSLWRHGSVVFGSNFGVWVMCKLMKIMSLMTEQIVYKRPLLTTLIKCFFYKDTVLKNAIDNQGTLENIHRNTPIIALHCYEKKILFCPD